MKWLQSLPIHILILLMLTFMAIPAVGIIIHAGLQAQEETLKNAALIQNLLIMLLFLLLTFASSLWISRRFIVARIAALENASRSLANGDYKTKVSDHVTGGELGRLAESFDSMAIKLIQQENAFAKSERFLNSIIDTEPECIKASCAESVLTLVIK